MNDTTNFICNDTTGECYTISQTYLDYVDTSLNNLGYLVDRVASINMVFSAIIIFFLFLLTLKMYFANKKW